MKNITILAVLTAIALSNSLSANPVIVAELQKMESVSTAKDNQIADLLTQLNAKDALIAELKSNPDLETAVKVKFNQAVMDAKVAITKLTEEIVSKLKKGDK
jgi:DnaJ-class molecular chaperone